MKKKKKTNKPNGKVKLRIRNEYRQQKFKDLKRLIEEIGDYNVSLTKVGAEWKIPVTTMHRWKTKILNEMVLPDIPKVGEDILMALRVSMNICRLKIKSSKTERDRGMYMDKLCKLSETFTDMSERYFHKEKLAERVVSDNEIVLKWKETLDVPKEFEE